MKIFLIFGMLVAACNAFAQNYKIGHRTISWIDASRDNRSVKFEIYYPSAATGNNTPVIANGQKFPLLVFGHGYQLTYSDYIWLKDSVVPKGFFLVFPRTEEQLFPSHTDFAKDYAFIINRFEATRQTAGNWYYNRIKGRYAVGGHSMGGGCSLLSIQYSSKITAVFNFAAAETNPSAIAASSNITIPALLFAGGEDCISPPASNQLPMYNNIQNVCKTYVLITAAKHCHWSNNGSCRTGEIFCSPHNTSPRPTLATTFSLLLPWLNDKLNSNTNAAQTFQQLLISTSGITYKQNCGANNIVSAEDEGFLKNNQLKVVPSKTTPGTTIKIVLPEIKHQTVLRIFSQSGDLIYTKDILQLSNKNIQIVSSGFKKGIYFIVITDADKQYKNAFVIE